MTQIFSSIKAAFAFQSDPIGISIMLYLSILIIPVGFFFLGKALGQKADKITGIISKSLMALIIVTGLFFTFDVIYSEEELPEEVLTVFENGDSELREPQMVVAVQKTQDKAADGSSKTTYELAPDQSKAKAKAEENNIKRPHIMLEDGSLHYVGAGISFYSDKGISSTANLSMVLAIICIGMMVGFGILGIIQNPQAGIKAGIFVGGFLLIFLIAWMMTDPKSSDISQNFLDTTIAKDPQNITTESVKQDWWDSAISLNFTFILLGVALVAWIGGEVYSIVKKMS